VKRIFFFCQEKMVLSLAFGDYFVLKNDICFSKIDINFHLPVIQTFMFIMMFYVP